MPIWGTYNVFVLTFDILFLVPNFGCVVYLHPPLNKKIKIGAKVAHV